MSNLSVNAPSYYRARYYDPSAGRFLSEDPFWGNGDHTPYSYVRNNPINYIDPSGMVPENSCECKGSSGGIRVAAKCCTNAPPVSPDEAVAPPYDPCFSYMFVNANFMFRHGGGSGWGNAVRGCLLCAYKYGSNSSAAHAFCYAEGSRQTRKWRDPVTPGMLSANYGLFRAVGGAAASLVDQGYDYVRSRGKRPFPCLNVK